MASGAYEARGMGQKIAEYFYHHVSMGDLIQLKVGKSAGSATDSIVTVVFTES